MIKNLFYSFEIIDKIDLLYNDDPNYSLRKDIFKEEIKTEKGHEKIFNFF